jgi:hypothetical protein
LKNGDPSAEPLVKALRNSGRPAAWPRHIHVRSAAAEVGEGTVTRSLAAAGCSNQCTRPRPPMARRRLSGPARPPITGCPEAAVKLPEGGLAFPPRRLT